MKRKLLAFLVCLCLMDLNLLGQARVSTISGIVSDFITNQPLADVNVYFLNGQTGTITQSNGSFSIRIKSVPTVLFFSHIGFEVQQVAIDSIPKIPIRVNLKPEVIEIKEVTVLGRKIINLYDSDTLFVTDYELYNDKIIMVASH